MSTHSLLELHAVHKRFDQLDAVSDLNLQVKRGEIFGFLGLNGAGKTTTIKLIAGLVKPTSGQILIDGVDVHRSPVEAKRGLAYIPDDPYLYDKLTGRECLELVAGLHDVPQEEVKPRIEELLGLFEIESYADQLTENYSHGTKQKFVFATAFIHRPRLMLVDEPMVGLDPQNAHLVKTVLRELATESGVSVFVSTHTLSLAEAICDRIGIIHQGRVLAMGTLDELRAQAPDTEGGLEELFLELTGRREDKHLTWAK